MQELLLLLLPVAAASGRYAPRRALGNLFRRRGEVERAIRIHQNLIACPALTREQRAQALLEPGQDDMRAGLLDRAENLFRELKETELHVRPALTNLNAGLPNGRSAQFVEGLRPHIRRLLDEHPVYQCTHGGFSARTQHWQCPSCRRWSTLKRQLDGECEPRELAKVPPV